MFTGVKERIAGVKERFNAVNWKDLAANVGRVGRWFNIDLTTAFGILTTVHWSVVAMLGVVALFNPGMAGWFALALLSVVPHEYGHALVARHYKLKTERIVIYPVGGIAFINIPKPLPRWQEFWVAIAGPIVSLALSVFGFVMFFLTGEMLWVNLGVINLVLVVFNLLPAFPMDGGRVLRSILEWKMSHLEATRLCVKVSIGLAIAMGLIGLLTFNVGLLLTAFLIPSFAKQELARLENNVK